MEIAWSHLEKGQLLLSLGRIDDAKNQFTAALNIIPNLPQGLLGIALCHFHLKDYILAKETLETGLKDNPDIPEFYFLAALNCRALGNSEKALSMIQRALEIRPSELGFNLAAAELYMHQGILGAAKHHLDIAGNEDPENSIYRSLLVTFSKLTGSNIEIRQNIMEGLRQNPEDHLLLFHRSMSLPSGSNAGDRKAFWSSVIEQDPNDALAKENYIDAYLGSNKLYNVITRKYRLFNHIFYMSTFLDILLIAFSGIALTKISLSPFAETVLTLILIFLCLRSLVFWTTRFVCHQLYYHRQGLFSLNSILAGYYPVHVYQILGYLAILGFVFSDNILLFFTGWIISFLGIAYAMTVLILTGLKRKIVIAYISIISSIGVGTLITSIIDHSSSNILSRALILGIFAPLILAGLAIAFSKKNLSNISITKILHDLLLVSLLLVSIFYYMFFGGNLTIIWPHIILTLLLSILLGLVFYKIIYVKYRDVLRVIHTRNSVDYQLNRLSNLLLIIITTSMILSLTLVRQVPARRIKFLAATVIKTEELVMGNYATIEFQGKVRKARISSLEADQIEDQMEVDLQVKRILGVEYIIGLRLSSNSK